MNVLRPPFGKQGASLRWLRHPLFFLLSGDVFEPPIRRIDPASFSKGKYIMSKVVRKDIIVRIPVTPEYSAGWMLDALANGAHKGLMMAKKGLATYTAEAFQILDGKHKHKHDSANSMTFVTNVRVKSLILKLFVTTLLLNITTSKACLGHLMKPSQLH